MSTGAVNKIIQRAISDAAFRRQLQRDPQNALTGFDLTTDERAAITSGDPSRLTALGVDQRMSKAFGLGGLGDVSKVIVGDNTSGSAAFIDENSSGASRGLVGDDTTGSAALVGDNTSGTAALVGDNTSGSAAMIGDPSHGSSALISPDGHLIDAGMVSDDTTGATHAIVGDPTSGTAALDPGDTSGIASELDSAGLDTGGDVHPTEY